MTTAGTPPAAGPTDSADASRRRRRLLWLTVAVVLVAAVAGLVLAWYLFFGSEAPPVPSIDDAVQVLRPSLPPT